jgi:hypothetical protein
MREVLQHMRMSTHTWYLKLVLCAEKNMPARDVGSSLRCAYVCMRSPPLINQRVYQLAGACMRSGIPGLAIEV